MIIENALYDEFDFTHSFIKRSLRDDFFDKMTENVKLRFFNHYIRTEMDIEDPLFTEKLWPFFEKLDYFKLQEVNAHKYVSSLIYLGYIRKQKELPKLEVNKKIIENFKNKIVGIDTGLNESQIHSMLLYKFSNMYQTNVF